MPEETGSDRDKVQFDFGKESLARIEADYQDRMIMFRASVIRLLSKANALHEGKGWAVFYLESDEENRQEHPVVNGGFKDMLILLDSGEEETAGTPPSIRILTNESYETPDGLTWLVQDFSLDHEGDSQYLVDVCNYITDPGFKNTLATFFMAEDDNLFRSRNFMEFTPYFEVADEIYKDGAEICVAPFGYFTCLEDKVSALNYGISLLQEIVNEQPYARMTKAVES